MIQPIDPDQQKSLEDLLDLEVPLSVVFAEKTIPLRHLLNYSKGSVIVLDGVEPQQLELRVGDTVVGHGCAVTVGKELALRVDQVTDARQIAQRFLAARDESLDSTP